MSAVDDFKVKVVRSQRRTTALHIVGATVLVRTNFATRDQEITDLLNKHQSWIKKKLNQPKADEVFLLLGQEYQIEKVASGKYGYSLQPETLTCYVSKEEDLLQIYDEIYLAHQDQLKAIIKHCLERFPDKPKAIYIKRLKSAFGICHKNKKISINLYVLKYSPAFIEMVVYHELCHLSEMNHSTRFYDLLRQYAPNYRQIRKEARP